MTTTTPLTDRETRIRLVEATEAYRAAMVALGFTCRVTFGGVTERYRSLVEIHVDVKREGETS